jgi:RNA polymerase sigma-70 factor (ECF subfamily)
MAVRRDGKPLERRAELERFLLDVERKALRIASFALGQRDDALDAVQESMFKLTRYYAQRPASEWPPLFFRILHNQIQDFHRARHRRPVMAVFRPSGDQAEEEADLLANLPGAERNQPEVAFERARNLERLSQIIESLPRRQREAFILRLLEGWDIRTTARVMGCSEGSIKTHLSRALHALRQQMEDPS